MRWIKPAQPLPGSFRVVRKFLYLPLILGRERRWLEFANIVEMYDGMGERWETICFEDEKTSAMELVETPGEKTLSSFSKCKLLEAKFAQAISNAEKCVGLYSRRRMNLEQRSYLGDCYRGMIKGCVSILEGIILQLANEKNKEKQLPNIDKSSGDCPELEQRIDKIQKLVDEGV